MMRLLTEMRKIRLSLAGLIYYDELPNDPKVGAYCRLLETLTEADPDVSEIYFRYHGFYKEVLGLNWPCYLVQAILKSENAFALKAARGGWQAITSREAEDVRRDLRNIQKLAQITPGEIKTLVSSILRESRTSGTGVLSKEDLFSAEFAPENWPEWEDGLNLPQDLPVPEHLSAQQWLEAAQTKFIAEFLGQGAWENGVALLAERYARAGCGVFGSFAAFSLEGGKLRGIKNPDPVRLNNLICQEREQELVLNNTESFLKGFPANNMILYGNRGTGKSSLVKALLNEYAPRGLRLVQLRKNQMSFFPELAAVLAAQPLKFIIYIDDLSFNEDEQDYKALKSLLEGGIEARPANVLFYATSNRKNLIKETFAERRGDDVQTRDNMEEKLSLADRFGITVTFLSPDQETYLKIVEGIAAQSGIKTTGEELRRKALQWVMFQHDRSGRTARQFIDYLRANETGLD